MIETLIRTALMQIPIVQGCIAKHNNNPAVFYQTAPHDKDPLWNGKQYPRIDYTVDWQYNPERRTSGNLQVNVWCINDGTIPPEDIGEAITPKMTDLFLTDESGTYCVIWSRTDAFEGAGNEPKTIGVTISFDIVAFPAQTGGTLDAVRAIMDWIKVLQPSAVIINKDTIPPIWKPTNQSPAVYVRIGGGDSAMRPSNAVVWVTQQQTIHVICPSVGERQRWIMAITSDMSIRQETTLTDNSPLFVKRLSYNTASNPITQGQINATVEYGVLRSYPQSTAMNHISFTRGGQNGN